MSLLLVEDPTTGLVQGARAEVAAGETTEVEIGRAAEPGASSLVGRITAGGRPLPGLFVIAGSEGTERKMGRTDEEGRFRLEGLAGETQVEIYLGDPRAIDDFSIRSTAPLALDAGAERRLDLDLPAGVVKVTLVDEVTGKPVPGGVAFARTAERGIESDRFAGFTASLGWGGRTGEDGSILLVGLVPGRPHVVLGTGETYRETERPDVVPGTHAAPTEVVIRVAPRAP